MDVIARIPFDNAVTEAIVGGIPAVEYAKGKITGEMEALWRHVSKALEK